MKEDNDILNRIDHRDGMTVPEGYFAEFAQRMAASLPVTEFEESEKEKLRHRPRTLWQTIRPYAYMAAMFAGVWCMMKMFTAITTPSEGFASSPTLAEAMDNEIFVNDYIIDDVDQWELVDQMMEDGVDLNALSDSLQENAFTTVDYQYTPEADTESDSLLNQ